MTGKRSAETDEILALKLLLDFVYKPWPIYVLPIIGYSLFSGAPPTDCIRVPPLAGATYVNGPLEVFRGGRFLVQNTWHFRRSLAPLLPSGDRYC